MMIYSVQFRPISKVTCHQTYVKISRKRHSSSVSVTCGWRITRQPNRR